MKIKSFEELYESNDEMCWNYYEGEGYKLKVRENDKKLDEKLSDVKYINSVKEDEFYDFLLNEYYPWKYTDGRRCAKCRSLLKKGEKEELIIIYRMIKNYMKQVEQCEGLSYIRPGIELVSMIPGLGVAGSSGLLSLMMPEKFGTVDQYVVENLKFLIDININKNNISVGAAVTLEKAFIKISKEINQRFDTKIWTPRKIDKVLWSIRPDDEN